jgi:hypothetical protein
LRYLIAAYLGAENRLLVSHLFSGAVAFSQDMAGGKN